MSRKKRVLTEEHKKKIGKAHLGMRHKFTKNKKPMSEETKRKIGEANREYLKIHPRSEETKRKISLKLKGRKLPEETRIKMSMAKKGKPFSGERCTKKGEHLSEEHKRNMRKNNAHYWRGKKMSIETRKKMGNAHRGEKGSNWQGGITEESRRIRGGLEYKLWREAIFKRDNFTCQKTGERGGKLVAHHIQTFSQHEELRFAIDNGITLTKKAHIYFHKKYGKNNNTREQLTEFLEFDNLSN